MKKIIAILITISIILSLSACGGRKAQRYEAEFLELFDTMTQIVAYSESKDEFTKQAQFIYDNLKAFHELYDIYNNYDGINNIKTINDNAGIAPVKVDRRIIDMLLFAKREYNDTQGKMNVALGSVLKIWHDYRERGIDDPENAEVPPVELLQAAAKHTDINQVVIDENASTVFLNDPEMSLDVGGIAKGYATEQVAQLAMKNGFESGLISVGGNVRAIGRKTGSGELWNVGVQNPDEQSGQKNLLVTYLSDMSLVTSGDYERYYMVGDKKYHHIIDPDTLYPADYFTAVTIVCRDSGMADARTKAIFNMPFEQGLAYINSLPDTEALWVFKNGEIKYSDNFKQYIKQ